MSRGSGTLAFSPPAVLAAGFALLIAVGSLLLLLPFATRVPIGPVEAFFTATSAVTVTGLIVVDTATRFTGFGQAVIAGLIQLGGVGLMAFAVLSLLVAGGRPALRFQLLIGEALGKTRLGDAARVVRVTFLFALLFEVIGMILLTFRFSSHMPPGEALWQGLFHAVSAFNNAGFSLFSDSLVGYAGDPVVNLVVPALFIIGGLGFVVIADRGLLQGRASLHTRLMLRATVFLSLITMALFWWLEHDNPRTLGGLSMADQGLRAWFMATTPRTAGFNTIDVAALEPGSTVVTIWLMFIGGGTGSTAGGIKLMTFLVLVAATRAFISGRQDPVLLGRRLVPEVVTRALAIALMAMMSIAAGLLVLTILEPRIDFLDLVFEIVSAFGTVGLSRGITEELDTPARLLLCLAMFIGRLGPLSLAFLLATTRPSPIRAPRGVVHVG